jgi:hypothetical protein
MSRRRDPAVRRRCCCRPATSTRLTGTGVSDGPNGCGGREDRSCRGPRHAAAWEGCRCPAKALAGHLETRRATCRPARSRAPVGDPSRRAASTRLSRCCQRHRSAGTRSACRWASSAASRPGLDGAAGCRRCGRSRSSEFGKCPAARGRMTVERTQPYDRQVTAPAQFSMNPRATCGPSFEQPPRHPHGRVSGSGILPITLPDRPAKTRSPSSPGGKASAARLRPDAAQDGKPYSPSTRRPLPSGQIASVRSSCCPPTV